MALDKVWAGVVNLRHYYYYYYYKTGEVEMQETIFTWQKPEI